MEKWASIIAYHGLYQISNYNRVRSTKRKNNKVLKVDKNNTVELSIDGNRKRININDLI
mgnify:CR=1 FL=1